MNTEQQTTEEQSYVPMNAKDCDTLLKLSSRLITSTRPKPDAMLSVCGVQFGVRGDDGRVKQARVSVRPVFCRVDCENPHLEVPFLIRKIGGLMEKYLLHPPENIEKLFYDSCEFDNPSGLWNATNPKQDTYLGIPRREASEFRANRINLFWRKFKPSHLERAKTITRQEDVMLICHPDSSAAQSRDCDVVTTEDCPRRTVYVGDRMTLHRQPIPNGSIQFPTDFGSPWKFIPGSTRPQSYLREYSALFTSRPASWVRFDNVR